MSSTYRTNYSLRSRKSSSKKQSSKKERQRRSIEEETRIEKEDYLLTIKRSSKKLKEIEEEAEIFKNFKHHKGNLFHEDDTKLTLSDLTNNDAKTILDKIKGQSQNSRKGQKKEAHLKTLNFSTKNLIQKLKNEKNSKLRETLFDNDDDSEECEIFHPGNSINFQTFKKERETEKSNLRLLDSCPKSRVKDLLSRRKNSDKNKEKNKFKTPKKSKNDKIEFDPTKHYLNSPKLRKDSRTISIIEKVKNEQSNSTNMIKHKLRSFKKLKLSERIEEYKQLSLKKEFHLSNKLEKLFSKFKYFDIVFDLSNQQNNGNCNFFKEISLKVLKSYRETYGVSELRKTLFLEEFKLFQVLWDKNERHENRDELLLKLPDDDENNFKKKVNKMCLDKRAKLLREKMVDFVKTYHENFLKKNNLDFSYEKEGCWHSDFDLSKEVPELPMIDLPEKPNTSTFNQKMSLFFKANDDKFKPMESAKYQRMLKKVNPFERKKSKEGESLSFEEIMIKAIKEKEKERLEQKKQSEMLKKRGFSNKNKIQIVRVANSIKMHYNSRKLDNMFLVKVVEKVYKTNKLNLIGKNEIQDLIDIIVMKSDGWLEYVDNEAGVILRMNKEIAYNGVLKKLKNGG